MTAADNLKEMQQAGPFLTRQGAEDYVRRETERSAASFGEPIVCVLVLRNGAYCFEPLRDVRHDATACIVTDRRRS